MTLHVLTNGDVKLCSGEWKFSLNIYYLINSLHVYKQEHTYKSITEFINWDSERSLDDLFKSVSNKYKLLSIILNKRITA